MTDDSERWTDEELADRLEYFAGEIVVDTVGATVYLREAADRLRGAPEGAGEVDDG